MTVCCQKKKKKIDTLPPAPSSQANYADAANVPDPEQERRFQEARRRLAPWSAKARPAGGSGSRVRPACAHALHCSAFTRLA